jgi:hypothetical protein
MLAHRRIMGLKARVRFPVRTKVISLLLSVQIGSRATQFSVQCLQWDFFSGRKATGGGGEAEADKSPPTRAIQVKNDGTIPPFPRTT